MSPVLKHNTTKGKIWQSRSLRLAAIAFGVLCAVLYVVQINVTATKGYEIRELERKLATLQHESRVLRLQSLELQSMERLQNQVLEQELLVAGRPDGFISATASAVASR